MSVEGQRKLGELECFVRYYKKKGCSNEETEERKDSPLKKDDFVLVLQSTQQSDILESNPRTLCVDSTHGVTGYDYFLMTLLVINNFGKGFPVAWAICSRENHLT